MKLLLIIRSKGEQRFKEQFTMFGNSQLLSKQLYFTKIVGKGMIPSVI